MIDGALHAVIETDFLTLQSNWYGPPTILS